MQKDHKSWHSRGYLPHFDSANTIQALTFRLADSMPKGKLLEMADGMTNAQQAAQFRHLEDLLDSGLGACVLRDSRAAKIVEDALLYFDQQRYALFAWVVMPNHVHVLFQVFDGWPLGSIVHSWKSFTASAINRMLGLSGALWYPDYFDRYVRNGEHFDNALRYIEYNPVRAKLSPSPELFRFSSAFRRGTSL